MKTKIVYISSLLLFILISPVISFAAGWITGTVTENSKDPVPFASVSLKLNSVEVRVTQTDFDGKFKFDSVAPGIYSLSVSSVGYMPKVIQSVLVKDSENSNINIVLDIGVKLNEVLMVEYKSQPSGLFSSVLGKKNKGGARHRFRESNGDLNIRGSRNDATTYIVDGIKMKGNPGIQNHDEDYFQPEEQYDQIVENEFQSALREPLSTFSIDVDKASYSNVRRILESGHLPPSNSVRIEEMVNYFKYDYPTPAANELMAIRTEATNCPWDSSNILLKISIKAKDIPDSEIPPSNFVFLIDVSGSMSDENKLPLVIQSLKMLVKQLNRDDRVAIVVYAGSAGVVLKPTAGDEKQTILEALNRLEAGGSTAGGEGIKLAYNLATENFDPKKNNRVILCTDGDFNVGIQSDGDLIKLIEGERNKGIFLSVLGFGMGNYKDGKMEKLADKGNGNNFFIDDFMEAEKVLVREMKGSLYTLAKDVKLQIEFNPTLVSQYRLIGYENRLLNAEDFDNDQKDAGELGAGQTVTALYELIPVSAKTKSDQADLRYHTILPASGNSTDEFGIIKFRYKQPLDSTSKLFTHVINSTVAPFTNASTDLKFASAVTEFSMVLRESKFAGSSTLESALQLAKQNKGEDEDGDRAEFVKLCKEAITIAGNLSSK